MADTQVQVFFAIGLCCLGSLASYLYKFKRTLPLPPGPPADPVIGHLRTFPTTDAQVVFHKWAKEYGDVMHLTCLGHSIIVLDSHQAAEELLGERSVLYSDRPNVVVFDLMGWNPSVGSMPYGPRFRKHRRLLSPQFTQRACVQFQQIQLENAYLLAHGLLENKANHDHLLSRFTTAITIRIAYGHQILSDDDEYIKMACDLVTAFEHSGTPGGTPIDFFPILQYFPSWFPGTHYANVARSWRWAIRKLYDYPYECVEKQMAEGAAKFSFLSTQLQATAGQTLTDDEKDDLKGASAVIYAAGGETTWSTLATFFLAMVLYPEYQRLGQEELDRVIGRDRLPTFEDRDSLPFVDCLIQEVLRWNPVLPLGLPHRSTHDDIYRGMFIPKGSVVFANVYGISLDSNTYKNPTEFNPFRFLPKSEGGDEEPPLDAAFGFGRRICLGRYLANASLWIAISTIFSTLHISKAKDKNGAEITPSREFTQGLTSHPKPFPCNIVARSDKSSQLILEAVADIS